MKMPWQAHFCLLHFCLFVQETLGMLLKAGDESAVTMLSGGKGSSTMNFLTIKSWHLILTIQ